MNKAFKVVKYQILGILFILLLIAPASGTDQRTSEEILPRLQDGIPVTDWFVIGPFLTGSRESLVNPLAGCMDYDTGIVDLTLDYPSVLESGGRVSWQSTIVDEEGNLSMSFDNVDWDKINDEWGVSGIAFTCAAYTTFECDQKCEAMINASGIGSFYINGRKYSGDPYGHNIFQTPVVLDQGTNHVFLLTGGYGGTDSVKFEVLPAPATELIVLENDILVSDIVRGESNSVMIGVPILNTTNRWIEYLYLNQTASFSSIPPLTVLKLNFTVQIDPEQISPDVTTQEIPILVVWNGGSYETTATARVRNPEDSRLVTFISSIDFSLQKYGILFPTNYDPEKQYSLIFSTHGAGVECEGQVDAFEPKAWAFVVAPSNRRAFGFDWQDWGRLDAMEVLDQVMEQYPIDPNRVYLVGHSMGGHGAWHLGCTYPDRFAAVVPSAGWASFQLYFPWFLRADEMFADPNCARIFDQCTSPDRTERLLENLRNVPVLAVQGGNDDDVPPTHARLLTGILEQMGYDARLWEEPGQPHWWDMHPGIPGTDCVDALRIRSFCEEHVRDPYPRHVTFVSYDLGNNNSSYWITVDEEISPIGRIYVDAELKSDGSLEITTENVLQFTIHISENSPLHIPRIFTVDNQVVDFSTLPDNNALELELADNGWQPNSIIFRTQNPMQYLRGPIKRAYSQGFYIVAGQSGTEEQNELNLEIARELANRWWYRANGYVRIFTDTILPDNMDVLANNVILIGGPETNQLSADYAASFPIQMQNDGIWLGDQFIGGEDLACQFVYPRPEFEQVSLVHCIWGNSLEGMRLSGNLTCLYSGSNLPDFLIYDDDVRMMGYAGVKAAGFFDNQWSLNPDYYYLRR
jgi:pimeloyl-ACP methyl ester carboxylesterase